MNFWEHPSYGKLPILDSNNSMGLIRYFLAFAVVIAHFNIIFDYHIPFFISSYTAVGGFFSLSGFLLYGSYMRNSNLKNYLIRRSRRLLPAYFLIVSLCAFFLVFVSTYKWNQYFFNSEWIRYLVFNLSFLNFLQPDLPGVFSQSDINAVNGSLWTMKVEIMLYLTVPIVLFVSDRMYKKHKFISPLKIFLFIYLISLLYRVVFLMSYQNSHKGIYLILERQFLGQLMYFYSGVFIYFIYDRFIKYRAPIIFIGIGIFIIIQQIFYLRIFLSPIIVSALVIALSSFKGKWAIFNFNNISYDIYLFHFPIIQIFYQFRHVFKFNIPLIFCLSLLFILILSLFSWFFIEKKFLPRKFI